VSGTDALLTVFRALRRFNDGVSAVAIALGMAIVAFAVLALLAAALERHVWGYGYAWMNDLPPYLLPWCVFPIMGVLLRGDRHIQVEVAPALLEGRRLHGLRLVVGLIVFVSAVYFCLAGWEATAFFKMLGQVTETEIQIPFWWLYAAFPAGFAVLASFALEAVLSAGLSLTGRPVEEVVGGNAS
jgi:TRAP-type C4-dicarboxylate transport system permease small subunit